MNPRETGCLEQYTSFEYILLGDLRDLLQEPIDADGRKWLIAVLDSLLETLPREFNLEEEDGYMSEVLERFPNWTHQVDRLHHDHEVLFAKLQNLRDRIGTDSWLAPIAQEVRRDLRDWMQSLIAHHRSENRLVQTAMNLEVGCGD